MTLYDDAKEILATVERVRIVGPASTSAEMLFWSTLWTAAGALYFLVGAYLLVPEFFDTD